MPEYIPNHKKILKYVFQDKERLKTAQNIYKFGLHKNQKDKIKVI